LYEIEKLAKELREQISKYVLDEIDHAGKETLSYNGYSLKKVSSASYSYKDEEIDRLKALLKGRQDMMKPFCQVLAPGRDREKSIKFLSLSWPEIRESVADLPEGGRAQNGAIKYDYFHLNTITVLPETPLGIKDDRFRAGNLLVCFRNVNHSGFN